MPHVEKKISDVQISVLHVLEYDLDWPVTLVSQINLHTVLMSNKLQDPVPKKPGNAVV